MGVLLWVLGTISTLLYGHTVVQLANPVYDVREAADCQLQDAGLLCIPALVDGLNGRSPECAARCRVLLTPWRSAGIAARVYWALITPGEPDAFAFWLDTELVERMVLWFPPLYEWPQCIAVEDWEAFEWMLRHYRNVVR